MSLWYYNILEKLLLDIHKWKTNQGMTKEDVIDSVCERVIMLMLHVVTSPMIGSSFAYPGDLDLSELMRAYDNAGEPSVI